MSWRWIVSRGRGIWWSWRSCCWSTGISEWSNIVWLCVVAIETIISILSFIGSLLSIKRDPAILYVLFEFSIPRWDFESIVSKLITTSKFITMADIWYSILYLKQQLIKPITYSVFLISMLLLISSIYYLPQIYIIPTFIPIYSASNQLFILYNLVDEQSIKWWLLLTMKINFIRHISDDILKENHELRSNIILAKQQLQSTTPSTQISKTTWSPSSANHN